MDRHETNGGSVHEAGELRPRGDNLADKLLQYTLKMMVSDLPRTYHCIAFSRQHYSITIDTSGFYIELELGFLFRYLLPFAFLATAVTLSISA